MSQSTATINNTLYIAKESLLTMVREVRAQGGDDEYLAKAMMTIYNNDNITTDQLHSMFLTVCTDCGCCGIANTVCECQETPLNTTQELALAWVEEQAFTVDALAWVEEQAFTGDEQGDEIAPCSTCGEIGIAWEPCNNCAINEHKPTGDTPMNDLEKLVKSMRASAEQAIKDAMDEGEIDFDTASKLVGRSMHYIDGDIAAYEDTVTMTLEEKLIAMVDSGTIELEVAQQLLS